MNRTSTGLGLSASRGFSFIEMIVVVAIVGILASIALPSFTTMIESERAKSVAVDLVISLTRARSEALKLNTNVTLSPVGGSWNAGWQILEPSTSAVLDNHGAVSGLTVTGPASVTYRSSGRVLSGGSFTVSGSIAASTRYVCLDLSGRPTIKTTASC